VAPRAHNHRARSSRCFVGGRVRVRGMVSPRVPLVECVAEVLEHGVHRRPVKRGVTRCLQRSAATPTEGWFLSQAGTQRVPMWWEKWR